jgi:hypothetical protein
LSEAHNKLIEESQADRRAARAMKKVNKTKNGPNGSDDDNNSSDDNDVVVPEIADKQPEYRRGRRGAAKTKAAADGKRAAPKVATKRLGVATAKTKSKAPAKRKSALHKVCHILRIHP